MYSVGLQYYHYNNVDYGFGITKEELAANRSARMVATSCRDVLDEYFSTHQHLDRRAGERLIIL